jgi:nucleotide-binding universal stress UspA family protein
MFKTIIWATDGSETADAALPFARMLAERDGAKLIAVHSEELMQARGAKMPVLADEEDLEAKIRRQVDELRTDGIDATFQLITGVADHTATMIADVARDAVADVIVTGTRGHGPVAGALVGSVTQRLLHIAPCPVLAVPPGGVRLAAERVEEATAAR